MKPCARVLVKMKLLYLAEGLGRVGARPLCVGSWRLCGAIAALCRKRGEKEIAGLVREGLPFQKVLVGWSITSERYGLRWK